MWRLSPYLEHLERRNGGDQKGGGCSTWEGCSPPQVNLGVFPPFSCLPSGHHHCFCPSPAESRLDTALSSTTNHPHLESPSWLMVPFPTQLLQVCDMTPHSCALSLFTPLFIQSIKILCVYRIDKFIYREIYIAREI